MRKGWSMKKKRSPVLLVLTIAVFVAAAGAVWFVWDHFTPTRERMAPGSYFGTDGEDRFGIVTENGTSKTAGKRFDGEDYLPVSVVGEGICPSLFYDEAEEELIITTPTTMESFDLDERYDIIRTDGEETFISRAFVEKYAEAEWLDFAEPDRLVVKTVFAYPLQDTAKDSAVRYRAGIKSPIITDLPAGTAVRNLDADAEGKLLGSKIEGWTHVLTEDGYRGYVQDEYLAENVYMKEDTHEYTEEPYSHILLDGPVSMVFHQTTSGEANDALAVTAGGMEGVNVIAPTWFFLENENGEMSSLASASYVRTAHEMGLSVWAVANDFDGAVNSASSTAAVLKSSAARSRIISDIFMNLLMVGADGICLDFEKVNAETAPYYLEFIREMSVMARNSGIVLSICCYVPTYTKYLGRAEMARVADYVITMCYDEHNAGSEKAGPVASLPFVKKGIEDTLAEVPGEQTIAALPFYTRLWTTGENGSVKSRAMGLRETAAYIADNGMSVTKDEKSGLPYAMRKGVDGTYEIWQENAETLADKLAVVREEKIAGAAYWKLELAEDSVWGLLSGFISGGELTVSVSGNSAG